MDGVYLINVMRDDRVMKRKNYKQLGDSTNNNCHVEYSTSTSM